MADRDLKAEVQAMLGLPVGPSTQAAYAVTGEPYVTIRMAGVTKEGAGVAHPVSPDIDGACDTFLERVKEYAAERGDGVLYWRIAPEVLTFPAGFDVRARLLISNKPVLGQEGKDFKAATLVSLDGTEGPTIVVTDDMIRMDDKEIAPVDALEMLNQWVSAAREHGWTMRDRRGLAIDLEATLTAFFGRNDEGEVA